MAQKMKNLCGNTTAFILAQNPSTTPTVISFEGKKKPLTVGVDKSGESTNTIRPLQIYKGKTLLEHTLLLAYECQFANIVVLANAQHAEALQNIVDTFNNKQGAHVSVLVHDACADTQTTESAANFELFGISYGVLQRAFAEANNQGQDKRQGANKHQSKSSSARKNQSKVQSKTQSKTQSPVMFFNCDQPRIQTRHIEEIMQAFKHDASLDAITSWIVWQRRTPLLVTPNLMQKINKDSLTAPLKNTEAGKAFRKLPNFKVQEIVFGEEKICANEAELPAYSQFLKTCTLSAKEAIAQVEKELKAGKSPNITNAHAKPKTADELLLTIARAYVTDKKRATYKKQHEKNLEWADAWAQRNTEDFPLLNAPEHANKLAYLDSAATTQRLSQTIDAQTSFDTHANANVYRGTYDLSMNATFALNDAREELENFIGAKRRETIYTKNTTDGASIVASAWGEKNISKNDTILVAATEHHSNLLPWLLLARRKSAEIVYIPYMQDGTLDISAYTKLISKKNKYGNYPRLVCIAHIGNVLGITNPVQKMAELAHKKGARFFLDAAQSAPHLSINVYKIKADFIAFSAHKMYGPFGVGALWVHPQAFAEMEPASAGGGVVSHASYNSVYLREGAIQYEAGTPPIAQAIAWAAAIKHLRILGMPNVERAGAIMTSYALHEALRIPGLSIWGTHKRAAGNTGLISATLVGMSPAFVGKLCGKMGVAIRSGGHCALPFTASLGILGTIRPSFAIHTTLADVDALEVALRVCSYITHNPLALVADSLEEAKAGVAYEKAANNANAHADISTTHEFDVAKHYGKVAKEAAKQAAETSKACDTCNMTWEESLQATLGGKGKGNANDAQHANSKSANKPVNKSANKALSKSEAFNLYAKSMLANLPQGALTASRGCGDPVSRANLKPQETVLDLGSGGGIDALLASGLVGARGHVYGLDMTPEMIKLARANAKHAGVNNVEFIKGSIEDIPLKSKSVNVVISNCVINFANNKEAVFKEAARVLKPGGRLVVSDIVAFSKIPESKKHALQELTGCRNGISYIEEYRALIKQCGFKSVRIEKKTVYTTEVLEEKAQRKKLMSEFKELTRKESGITGSVIVYAVR